MEIKRYVYSLSGHVFTANKIAWRAKPQSWRYRSTIGLRALVESLQIGRPIPNLFQDQFPHHAPKQMLLFWLVENRRQDRWLAGGGRVAKRCGGWMVGGGWAELAHVPVTERHLVTHRGHLQPQDELPLLIVEGNAIPKVIWLEKIKWPVGEEEKNEGCVGRSYDAAYR